MSTDPKPDRVTAIYDAIDAFQRTHRLPGLQHAQLRGLLAEHLARAVPVESAPSAVRARVLHDAILSEVERRVLTEALDLAEKEMLARGDDEAEVEAVSSLRRLAAEPTANTEVAVDLTDGPVCCPLCPNTVTIHTPNGARAHFAAVHPEQRITGRRPGPWPLLVNDGDEAQPDTERPAVVEQPDTQTREA